MNVSKNELYANLGNYLVTKLDTVEVVLEKAENL
jgi:hypothetical protein